MKRLGLIIQMAKHQTKTKPQTTNTDDTQIPRPDLRIAKEKQQRSKTRKGVKAQTKNILREKQVLQFKHTSIFFTNVYIPCLVGKYSAFSFGKSKSQWPSSKSGVKTKGNEPRRYDSPNFKSNALDRSSKSQPKIVFFCLLWFGRLCTMARSLAVKQKARPKDQRVQ